MRVVADQSLKTVEGKDGFIFDNGSRPIADELAQLLCIQYGDLNNKPPFMFWSQRSLGFLLYEPAFWSNMILCRQVQFVMQSFNPWFRVTDPAGKASGAEDRDARQGDFTRGSELSCRDTRTASIR